MTLVFDSVFGGFNDELVLDFIKDKEVVSIRDHFFIHHEVPYLTLVIGYFPFRQECGRMHGTRHNENWKKLLIESEVGLFDLLRNWRTQRCQKEGIPPYLVFTNLQLVQMVKNRPQSLADLLKITGVGRAKIEKYGHDILKITQIQQGAEMPPPEKAGEPHESSP